MFFDYIVWGMVSFLGIIMLLAGAIFSIKYKKNNTAICLILVAILFYCLSRWNFLLDIWIYIKSFIRNI